MRSFNFIFSVFLVLSVLLIIRCDKQNNYVNLNQPEVYGLKVVNDSCKVAIFWNDPANHDFSKVEISYMDDIVEVEKGIMFIEIDGLLNDTTYTVKLRTVNIDGVKSPGIKVHTRPRALPKIFWKEDAVTTMDTSSQGYPNGVFTTTRACRNIGSTGYVTCIIRLIELESQSILSEINKNVLVPAGNDYLFYYEAQGDISIVNCTSCDAESFSHRVEFSFLSDTTVFYAEPITCEEIPLCLNGESQRSIRWNSITTRELLFFIDE